MIDAAASPKKKRKKGTSPTARTLVECRKRGWIAQVVERTLPHTFIKQDLFGVIDIVVLTGSGILGIQATGDNAGDMQKRVRKIAAEPRALAWLKNGGALEVWGWGRRGAHGKRKLWTLRTLPIGLADYADGATQSEATP